MLQPSPDKESYLENEFVHIWIEHGIIHLLYKPKVAILDIHMAKKFVVGDRMKVSNGRKMPIIVHLNNTVSIDKEARKYFASKESVELLTAGVILVKSSIQRMGVNIFFKIDKPPMPTKAFTDYEKAIRWLDGYKIDEKKN